MLEDIPVKFSPDSVIEFPEYVAVLVLSVNWKTLLETMLTAGLDADEVNAVVNESILDRTSN